ncbi:retinoschisin-like [Actinia tenebrosa]|uniref:Retinoschisin-like n=1 Tax=Actinia tenebrosa TaxID=6105 RepID=A0A6P8HLT0_ACTTE|nr:retinoschisin-like [Actinia tenebrosa]
MSSFKAYNGDISIYGAKNARLMKTSSPQGYRGDKSAPKESWITVDFEKKLVITAIATQGYGDPTTDEWVTKFVLLYFSNGQNFKPLKDEHDDINIFIGNNDSSTVHRQNIPLPVIVSQIIILPKKWNNNVGLRMELYGCEPEDNYVISLMF